MTVGERIKRARKGANLTQEELGEKLDVSGVTIMRYETGQRQPSLKRLKHIAAVLDVPIEELLGEIKTLHIPIEIEYPLRMPSQEQIEKMTATEKEYYRLRLMADVDPEGLKRCYNDNYDKLNKLGKVEAVIRTTELTRLHEYTEHDPQAISEDE